MTEVNCKLTPNKHDKPQGFFCGIYRRSKITYSTQHRHLKFRDCETSKIGVRREKSNLDLTKCQGTGKLVRYIEGSLYRGSFPYITLLLGWKISFVIPRTSLHRGSLNRDSTATGTRRYSLVSVTSLQGGGVFKSPRLRWIAGRGRSLGVFNAGMYQKREILFSQV